MRTFVPVLLAVGAFALTGCPSTQSLCTSGVDQVCERSFECQPEQVRSSQQFQAVFGTTVEECKQMLYANPLAPAGAQGIACEEVDNDQELCSNLGQPDATSFNLGAAQDCRDQRAELSCEAYLAQLQDPTKAPAVCAERCE